MDWHLTNRNRTDNSKQEIDMIAYHGSKELKAKCLDIMARHRKADTLVQNHGYWSDGKGCAVGCMLHTLSPGSESNHSMYNDLIGVPEELARLEDCIFEGLPAEQAKKWPERFLKAINPGADLSMVWPKLAVKLLVDPDHGVVRHVDKGSSQEKPIVAVADLYKKWIDGYKPEQKEFAAAEAAAWAARAAAMAAARQWIADTLIELLMEAR